MPTLSSGASYISCCAERNVEKGLDANRDTDHLAILKATDFEERPLTAIQQSVFEFDISTYYSHLVAVV